MLCLIFAMVFSIPVFANPEVENSEESQIVVPDNISNAEAYVNLKNFQKLVNNKGVEAGQETVIRVVKVPKQSEAATSSPSTSEDNSEVSSTPVEPAEEFLHFGLFDGQTFFCVEDEEFKIWIDEIVATVNADAVEGLKALKEVSVTLDHIKLKDWGEFLTKYNGKNENNFPMGNVVIEYGDYSFTFANSKECKEFILNYVVPPMVETIVEEAKDYPAKRYVLDIQSGSTLAAYECDLTKVRELKIVYPFDGVKEYLFFNTGDYFAVALGEEYVNILRGYIDGDKGGYDRRVEGSVPGCVNVLAHITMLRNLSNFTLSDKVLSDFTMYQNLAVCLDTKELIDVTDMTTAKQELYYIDYKIDPEKLLLTPISDTVVIIQPTYLECFGYRNQYGLYENNFGRMLDATEFISTGSPYLTTQVAVEGENGVVYQTQQIPLERFVDEFGILDVRLGNSPFLVFYVNYVPYDLLVNWYYTTGQTYFTDEVYREAFINQIKEDMEAQGRGAEFDSYVKAAGQMTDNTKLIIKVAIAFVVLIIVVVLIIIIRKKIKYNKENPVTYRSKVLFDNDDDGMVDDDDDFGGFELK